MFRLLPTIFIIVYFFQFSKLIYHSVYFDIQVKLLYRLGYYSVFRMNVSIPLFY